MRTIAVLSGTRLPSGPHCGHGLGLSAYEISAGLVDLGYDVTLFGGVGTSFPEGRIVCHTDETVRANVLARNNVFDAYLDTSHQHQLSKLRPRWRVVNRMADRECHWPNVPNTVVNSPFMKESYPEARLINTGIKPQPGMPIPVFDLERDNYLVFVGNPSFSHKGYRYATELAKRTGRELKLIHNMPGAEKYGVWARAHCLLHFTGRDAAPRVPLESAMLGVPTLCWSGDGSAYHVMSGVSGFSIRAPNLDAAQHLLENDVYYLDGLEMRDWAKSEHGYSEMIVGYENALLEMEE